MLKFAIIGCGFWAVNGNFLHFVKDSINSKEAVIVAFVEPNETRAEAAKLVFKDAQHYLSTEDLLNDDLMIRKLTGVFITTPHVAHYVTARMCLEKRLNVLLEKPMVSTVDQGYELVRLAKKNQVLLWINNTANFRPQAVESFNLISEGKLGNIEHVQCHMAGALRGLFSGEWQGWANTWAQPNNHMGGYGWGQLCHMLAFILKVTNLIPTEVFCFQNNGPTGVDLCSATSIRCSNGATISMSGSATLVSHTAERGKQIDIRVFGEKGSLHYCGRDEDPKSSRLEYDLQRNGKTVQSEKETFDFEETTFPPGADTKMFREDEKLPDILSEWIKACSGKDYFDGANGTLGFKVVGVIEAMYKSASTGQCIKLEFEKFLNNV